jgi:hypothetical protein
VKKNNFHTKIKKGVKNFGQVFSPRGRIGPNPFDPVPRKSEVYKAACAPK